MIGLYPWFKCIQRKINTWECPKSKKPNQLYKAGGAFLYRPSRLSAWIRFSGDHRRQRNTLPNLSPTKGSSGSQTTFHSDSRLSFLNRWDIEIAVTPIRISAAENKATSNIGKKTTRSPSMIKVAPGRYSNNPLIFFLHYVSALSQKIGGAGISTLILETTFSPPFPQATAA